MQIRFQPMRSLLATALALAAAPALAQDGTFSQTVFFGDSLTDSGYFRPVLVQVGGPQAAVLGRFTTNPGLVWAEYFADFYGTSAASNGNGQTGTNYAAGGARVNSPNPSQLGPPPSLVAQANAYLTANGGQADPNALYTVWGGANDLFAAAGAPAQAQQIIGAAVTAQIGIVGALQNAGAQYVLVPTIPDVGLAPSFRVQGPAVQGQASALASAYNTALFNGLASSGLSVIPVDTFHFLQEVAAAPAAYGFTNITGTACQPQITAQSITCQPATYVSPDAPNTYLFADGVHPTTRAHALVAELAISMIEGPRQIAILPHVASTVGRARADMVSGQTEMVKDDEDGSRWWVDARYDSQRYGQGSSADLYDGGGGGLTVGVDWTRNRLVYGAFGGFSHQIMDWGLRRGDFRQDDTTLGGYVGWSNDHLWVNGQVSYSQLGYDLKRKVRIGPVTRTYDSSVDGDNLSAGINAGWSFGDGAFRHGPIVGVLAQQIDIDGFAEDAPAESTSLAFPEQNFDSLIGTAGWQMSFAMKEHFVPYLRLTWDREFEDDATQARAQSQSIPGSLPYAVPGVEFDNTYGTLTYGTRSQLWGLDLLSGSSVTVGQKGGDNSSFFVTVRAEF